MYDKKLIFKYLSGFAAMMLAMKFTNGAGFIAIFVIFIAGAMKRDAVTLLYGLAITIAMLVGNSNLMPKGMVFGIAQRASMLLLSALLIAQVAGQRKNKSLSCFLMMFLYIIYMLVTSFTGWCPMISLMKLILFTSVFFAYFAVATIASNSRNDLSLKVRSVFLSIAIFFVVGSICLIPFPGISQLTGKAYLEAVKNGADITSLFMGMTFHSQSLGPITASIGAVLFADLLFGVRKPDKLYIVLLICVPILLWKTSSRTAMGTFIVGILVCAQMFLSSRGVGGRWKGKVTSTLLIIAVLLSLVALILPSVRQNVNMFITKYHREDNVEAELNMEEILMTRQGNWEKGIYNWERSPVVGNGFQVTEDMQDMKVGLTTLSAPVEKSVWISAILEEGGVFGFTIFLIFLIGTLVSLKRTKSYIGMTAFVTLIVINLGEFTIFSMSGIGGFLWAIVFIGVALDVQRNRSQNEIRHIY